MYNDQLEHYQQDGRIGLKCSYENFVDKDMEKRKELDASKGQTLQFKSGNKRYYTVKDLKYHGNEIYQGCNREMMRCHEIVYGSCDSGVTLYCIKFVDYTVDKLIVCKLFIYGYNRSLVFDTFRNESETILKDWLFPHCVCKTIALNLHFSDIGGI